MRDLFDQATSPEVLAEAVAIVLTVLLAMLVANYVKRWLRPQATRPDLSQWPRRFDAFDSVMRIVSY